MLNAMEQLMRLHPASHLGRWDHQPSDLEAFEELESRHLQPRPEYEAERREPIWMIGEVAAAAAMLVVFIGVLTAIARLVVDSPEPPQQPIVAVSETVELR